MEMKSGYCEGLPHPSEGLGAAAATACNYSSVHVYCKKRPVQTVRNGHER